VLKTTKFQKNEASNKNKKGKQLRLGN